MKDVALKTLTVVRQRGECCALPAVDRDWAERSSAVLKALADPTRLIMIAALWKARAPICICDFTAGLKLTQPTISHHMAKLREAGLVEWEKDGIWVYYRLRRDMTPSVHRLLAQLIA